MFAGGVGGDGVDGAEHPVGVVEEIVVVVWIFELDKYDVPDHGRGRCGGVLATRELGGGAA